MSLLKLPPENIYAKGSVTVFGDGTPMLDAEEYVFPAQAVFETHFLQEGQDLTQIAGQYYKGKVQNPGKYWHLIAKANEIEKPWDLSDFVGENIMIPDVTQYRLQ